MKKTLITILAAVPALICAGACTDFLYEGEVDLKARWTLLQRRRKKSSSIRQLTNSTIRALM